MAFPPDQRKSAALRNDALAVLGGHLKPLHENGISQVRFFGSRSTEESFTLADFRYAIAFKRNHEAGRPTVGTVDRLDGDDEAIFQATCRELIREGVLLPGFSDFQHEEFRVRLIPRPFGETWQLVRELGGGGQSRTMVVRRKDDGVDGVLKLIAPTETADETKWAKERFVREVRELRRVDHPAIARVLAYNDDEQAGDMGYVTPLGVPLEDFWEEKAATLTPSELYDGAFDLIRALGAGLTAVHELGLVHRDLKPDNVVMVGLQPVIIDFGLVTNLHYDAAHLTEDHGKQVGNAFNPPVVYGLDDADRRKDVAGLGWLYGFLVGEPIGGKRRPQRFHWQFHNLVKEPRAEQARAVLAVCSTKETIPATAADFCTLLVRLGLGPDLPTSASVAGPTSGEAEKIHAFHTARRQMFEIAEKEQARLADQIFAQTLTVLRQQLKDACQGSAQLPIRQFDESRLAENDIARLLALPPNAPLTGICAELQRKVAFGHGIDASSVELFYCLCGEKYRFRLSLSLWYSVHHREEGLKFGLSLLCGPEFGSHQPWVDVAFSFFADGTLRDDSGAVVATAQIAERARACCYNPIFWAQLG